MDCTKALELDPLYFKAVVRRAKAYLSLSRPEEALDGIFTSFLLFIKFQFVSPAHIFMLSSCRHFTV